IESKDRNGKTALEIAEDGKYVEVVQFLKQATVAIRKSYSKLTVKNAQLLGAATAGDVEKVKKLLASGANPKARGCECCMTAMELAASHSNAHIVKLLKDAGADVNATGGCEEKYSGMAELIAAAENGSADNVNALNVKGADVNRENNPDWTALMLAA